jgi:hypothetical protein
MALADGKFELDAAGAKVGWSSRSPPARARRRAGGREGRRRGAAGRPAGRLAARRHRCGEDAGAQPRRAGRPLRAQDCRARLFHLIPSERMRADALAQTLVSRKWTSVLLLTGPSAADQRAPPPRRPR